MRVVFVRFLSFNLIYKMKLSVPDENDPSFIYWKRYRKLERHVSVTERAFKFFGYV